MTSASRGRVLIGTAAVLTILFTSFVLSSHFARSEPVAAPAASTTTSGKQQQESPLSSNGGATAADVRPTINSEPPAVGATATYSAAKAATPETVSTPDPAAPTPDPAAPTPDPVPAAVPLPDVPPPAASSPEPAAAAVPAAAPDAASPRSDRVWHSTEAVNCRDSAGVEGSTVLAVIPGGQQVSGGDPIDGWVPVNCGAVNGWVSARYLADGPVAAAPATPAAKPAAGSSGNWMTDLIPQVDPNGLATWVFERNGGWGASDGHTAYIDPNIPTDKRFSVMVHEYSHVLQARVYGSLRNSTAALSAIVGGGPSDVTANESTADCMALMQGASWINYGCQDELRPAAAAILAGRTP
jgi:hypothetical protein